MSLALRARQSGHDALPAEIYLPLFDSLFQDARTLVTGSIFVTVSILLTYWKTGQPVLLYCALAVLVVGAARALVMRAYARARETVKTSEIARRGEFRYAAGASASVAILGFWCYAAFAWTHDPFAHLVSFSMTIAYTMGIFGRNFGRARFVGVQIVFAWERMTAALLLYGSAFHWVFAGLLIPFFLTLKLIAEKLRLTLLDAVITSRDMSLLAKRFDTALNNMPHGLCMFDSKRLIVVSNQKLKQQMGLAADLDLKGLTVRELVESIIKTGSLSDASAQSMIDC